jgi:hypothetical protein
VLYQLSYVGVPRGWSVLPEGRPKDSDRPPSPPALTLPT